jgi:response regulator RpfG family c-di-GMP phosphodiesterase
MHITRNRPTHKRSIVLIEDSRSMSLLVSALLKQWYNVINFNDVGQAWSWLKEGNFPDLIITCYHLPEINGLEFIKFLKTDSLFKEVPVILITAISPTDLPQEVYIQDISRIIHKPFDPRDFLKEVSEVMNRAKT